MFARTRTTLAIALVGSGLSHAKLPDVANHIPADAPIAIVVPSLNELNEQIQTALAALEMPGMFTLEQGLATLGIREGLDFNGSAAVVIPLSAFENNGESAIGLFPVTDYNAFITQFNAKINDGIASFRMGDESVVSKQIGSYAAIADSIEFLNAFTGQGNADALEAKMGTKVHTIANSSGIYIMVNHEPLAAQIGPLLDGFKAEIQADLNAGTDLADLNGMDPETIIAFLDTMLSTAQGFFEQGTMTIVGAEVSAFGYSVDAATSFTPGTQWANVFSAQGNASALFGLLPNEPFLFASTFDVSMPEIKELFTTFLDDLGPLMEQLDAVGGGQFAAMFDPDIIRLTDGQAQAMYVPEGGIMGGLFSGIVKVDVSSDPAALHQIMRNMLGALVGGDMMGDAANLTLDPDSVNVGNTTADAWSMQIAGDMGGNPMAAQFMGMFFGANGGPAGLLATGPRGVYTTYSQDPTIMESLLMLAPENSLATDANLQQIRGFLPEHCMAEFYFSPQATIDMLLPMAAMFGMQMDIPQLNMPPIGGGVATGNNEVHARFFVPMAVVQGLGQIGKAVQQQMMQPDDGDQGNPPF